MSKYKKVRVNFFGDFLCLSHEGLCGHSNTFNGNSTLGVTFFTLKHL